MAFGPTPGRLGKTLELNPASVMRVKRALRLCGSIALKIADQILMEQALVIKEWSQRIVPFKEGVLQGAFFLNKVQGGPKNVSEILLGYDTTIAPYAIIQHENLNYKHKAGKSAKFLEIPMAGAGDRMEASLGAAYIREARKMGRLP